MADEGGEPKPAVVPRGSVSFAVYVYPTVCFPRGTEDFGKEDEDRGVELVACIEA